MKETIIINSKDCANFIQPEEIIYYHSDNFHIQVALVNEEKVNVTSKQVLSN